MSKVIYLLLLFFITFLSCVQTPEKEIKKSFISRSIMNKKLHIKEVKIYDTIYCNDIKKELTLLERKIPYLKTLYRKMSSNRNSIIRLNYSRPKLDSMIRKDLKMLEEMDRETQILIRKQFIRYDLLQQIDNNICGYYVKIITQKDTFKVITTALTFRIVCPVFVFE